MKIADLITPLEIEAATIVESELIANKGAIIAALSAGEVSAVSIVEKFLRAKIAEYPSHDPLEDLAKSEVDAALQTAATNVVAKAGGEAAVLEAYAETAIEEFIQKLKAPSA